MTDQPNPTQEAASTEPMPRIFKIGSTRIVEDPSMCGLSTDDIKTMLAFQYPEVAHATVHETEVEGQLYIEFLPVAGTKG